jgi:hypothetical protein
LLSGRARKSLSVRQGGIASIIWRDSDGHMTCHTFTRYEHRLIDLIIRRSGWTNALIICHGQTVPVGTRLEIGQRAFVFMVLHGQWRQQDFSFGTACEYPTRLFYKFTDITTGQKSRHVTQTRSLMNGPRALDSPADGESLARPTVPASRIGRCRFHSWT